MEALVDRVRAFNRFYTREIGVLEEGLLETRHSLTEARVIFELAQGEARTLTDLRALLGLDAGYLSRVLSRLEGRGLIARRRAPEDGRRQLVALTSDGRAAFADLDARSSRRVAAQLRDLAEPDRERLTDALDTVEALLSRAAPPAVALRDLQPGDLGWIVERHGELYAREHGWDATFETLVARVVADFAAGHDPARERAWIATAGDRRLGAVLCVDGGDGVAKLRLLLVEPAARGRGVGTALVDACVAFARAAGYRELRLWTQAVLVAARRIYARAGFELVAQERVPERFGVPQTSETWRLVL